MQDKHKSKHKREEALWGLRTSKATAVENSAVPAAQQVRTNSQDVVSSLSVDKMFRRQHGHFAVWRTVNHLATHAVWK